MANFPKLPQQSFILHMLYLRLILRTEQISLYFLKNFEFIINKKKQNFEIFLVQCLPYICFWVQKDIMKD